MQTKDDNKNFFKFNILLKKRVSTTTIKIGNLNNIIDLKIGFSSNDQYCDPSFNNPGSPNCIVVEINK